MIAFPLTLVNLNKFIFSKWTIRAKFFDDAYKYAHMHPSHEALWINLNNELFPLQIFNQHFHIQGNSKEIKIKGLTTIYYIYP